MRLHTLLLVGSSVVLAAACRDRAPASTALNSDLKRDLEAAASTDGLQLANSAGSYQRAQFVSAIEQTNQSSPSKALPRPRPVVHAKAGVTPQEQKSPDQQIASEVAAPESPSPQPEAQAPAADEPRVPTVAPRPVAAPVEGEGSAVGGGGGRGAGAPPDIGEVIGVIMRGGRVGDDHCVPHRRPGGRGFPFPRMLETAPRLHPERTTRR